MNNQSKASSSSVRTLSLLLTLIVLVALLAIVVVRSRAQSAQENITQEVQSSSVAISVTNQGLDQVGKVDPVGWVGSSAHGANATISLTTGELSTVVHLTADVHDLNGVNTVLIGQPSASLHVIMVHGSTQETDSCSGVGYDGSNCWEQTWAGDAFSSSGVLTAAAGSDVVDAQLSVPIRLPYYAHDGAWTIYWKLIPVDASGNANAASAYENIGEDAVNTNVDKLVAIDVTTPSGTTAYYTAAGGGALTPGGTAEAVLVTVH